MSKKEVEARNRGCTCRPDVCRFYGRRRAKRKGERGGSCDRSCLVSEKCFCSASVLCGVTAEEGQEKKENKERNETLCSQEKEDSFREKKAKHRHCSLHPSSHRSRLRMPRRFSWRLSNRVSPLLRLCHRVSLQKQEEEPISTPMLFALLHRRAGVS